MPEASPVACPREDRAEVQIRLRKDDSNPKSPPGKPEIPGFQGEAFLTTCLAGPGTA